MRRINNFFSTITPFFILLALFSNAQAVEEEKIKCSVPFDARKTTCFPLQSEAINKNLSGEESEEFLQVVRGIDKLTHQELDNLLQIMDVFEEGRSPSTYSFMTETYRHSDNPQNEFTDIIDHTGKISGMVEPDNMVRPAKSLIGETIAGDISYVVTEAFGNTDTVDAWDHILEHAENLVTEAMLGTDLSEIIKVLVSISDPGMMNDVVKCTIDLVSNNDDISGIDLSDLIDSLCTSARMGILSDVVQKTRSLVVPGMETSCLISIINTLNYVVNQTTRDKLVKHAIRLNGDSTDSETLSDILCTLSLAAHRKILDDVASIATQLFPDMRKPSGDHHLYALNILVEVEDKEERKNLVKKVGEYHTPHAYPRHLHPGSKQAPACNLKSLMESAVNGSAQL